MPNLSTIEVHFNEKIVHVEIKHQRFISIVFTINSMIIQFVMSTNNIAQAYFSISFHLDKLLKTGKP